MTEYYDVHTHVGCDPGFMLRGWWPYAATARDLLVQMDAHGVRHAVCFPFTLPSAFDAIAFADRSEVRLIDGRTPFDRENRRLVEEIDRIDTDRRLLPFAMFDPSRRVPQQLENLRPLVGKIRGLKTQSTILQSPIRALIDVSRDLMELAQQHDLPVLFHTSLNDPWAQVADCLAVAEAFPRVRFNLAHSLRWHKAHLMTAAQMPNVWVDCSAHLNHCWLARQPNIKWVPQGDERVDADFANPTAVLETVHHFLGGRGKYLWGSDNPYMSWCDDSLRLLFTYEQEAAAFHGLPDDVKRWMGHAGPRAWLFGERGSAA
jgi:predicted TIM-barrel fold metal-dependent hydrolase